MGLATAAVLSVLLCLLGALTRRVNIVYVLMFILVFFSEYGTGFKSEYGSIFFNQNFMNFLNFKLIEIMIVTSYFFVLLTKQNRKYYGTYFNS